MQIQFEKLLTVDIAHSYYCTGCQDFTYFFPVDALKLMRDKKLIVRVNDGKLYILFEAGESGAALVKSAGESLRIGLKLLNPNFSNFTRPDLTDISKTPLYRNATDPAILEKTCEVELKGRQFSHVFASPDRPLNIMLKDSSGAIIKKKTVTLDNNQQSVSYDLTGLAAGAYTVEESCTDRNPVTAGYYCDPEIQPAGIFGILEINVKDSFYASPPVFHIIFQAREEVQKYYIVAKNYSQMELINIGVEDNGFNEENRPRVVYDRVEAAAFGPGEISPAILGGKDVQVVLFKSRSAVARREKAHRNIQLRKNGDILITHLLQPGRGRPDGNMIVKIIKP
jgi:hypothetical protein